MRIYKISFLLIFIIAVSACSTINVSHVSNTDKFPENDGLYYSLPKTAVTVEVTISKISKIKGPYSAYANKYLGISNVISENSSSYSIDKIKINSYSIPDTEQYYFVETPKCFFTKNNIFLQLTENGLISNVNENKKEEKASACISDLTGDSSTIENTETLANQIYINSNLAESFDTIIEKINLDTITIEKKVLKKILIEKTTEQKAKEAVDFIMRTKESKFNHLSGFSEVNYSKDALEYMCSQLDKIESEYLNLFTGITVKRQLKYYFTYIPEKTENLLYFPLFGFSDKYGITDTSELKSENVYIEIKRANNTNYVAAFELARQIQNPKKKAHGFYYRIPEYAKISLIYRNNIKSETNLLISQFGTIAELPAYKKLKILFYQNTGAIKSFELN